MKQRDFELVDLASRKAKRTNILQDIHSESKRKRLRNYIETNTATKLKSLKVIRDELKKDEIPKLVESLTSLLGCSHKLKEHKADLEYLATTLVAIYRFRGFTQSQAEKSFNSIFSQNIYQFPFPSHIYRIQNKEDQIKRKKDFLQNRSFIEQFTGIVNGFEKTVHNPFVIFRILNVKVHENVNVDFLYNGARVIDPLHEDAKKIIDCIAIDEHYSDFFDHKNFLICIFQISTTTNVGDYREIVYAKLQTIVNYINGRKKGVKAAADRSEYLTTIDFKNYSSGFSSNRPNLHIHKNDLHFLADNASNYLEGVNDSLKNTLLYTENLFWEGIHNTDLVKQWQYLENTTPSIENESRKVCTIVRNILLYRLKNICHSLYVTDFINIISNIGPDNRKEFPEDVVKQYNLRNYDDIDPYKATQHSKNSFIRSVGLNYKRDKSHSSRKEFVDHWDNIIVEARAYRNMIMHDGKYNELLERKLEVCLPFLTLHYRYACIDLVLVNKNRKDYEKLIMAKVKQKNM